MRPRSVTLVRVFATLLALVVMTLGAPVASARPAGADATTDAAAAEAPRQKDPKVVFIVGPVSEHTRDYLASANEGVREARRWTDRVVTIYTPNATWNRVRRELQGASIVVYLGHGNGWPSKYRDHLYDGSQNGLGLNPVAGANNDTTQYFGADHLRRSVKLAPNAVVLLHHLCYASGNTEPGLPEGTLDMSRQRVDNYAAGFIDIGARAVVAEVQLGPAYYIRQLLGTDRSIKDIWLDSPNFRNHVMTFPSVRSKGFTGFMDPNEMTGPNDPNPHRRYRSLVAKPKLTGREARAAGGSAAAPTKPKPARPQASDQGEPAASPAPSVDPEPLPTAPPTLRERGFEFEPAALADAPIAAGTVALRVKVKRPSGKKLPKDLTVAVRWDPLLLDDPALAGSEEATAPGTDPGASPAPSGSAPSASPAPTPGASAAPSASVAPTPDSGEPSASPEPTIELAPVPEPAPLAAPESLGEVVLTEEVKHTKSGLRATLSTPAEPGLYRLTAVLANGDGEPLADGGEPYIAPQLVRVFPSLSVSYLVSGRVDAYGGAEFALPVAVTNSGEQAWEPDGEAAAEGTPEASPDATETPSGDDESTVTGDGSSVLVVHWVDLSGQASGVSSVQTELPAIAPGKTELAELPLVAPSAEGEYLLLVDVLTATHGSLAAAGQPPAIVRVNVAAAPDVFEEARLLLE